MHRYTLTPLSDGTLRQSSIAVHATERSNTALAVAHLGEVEARGLHLPWGFSSISAYAIEELRLSADAAYNRIRVARKAREFPALFEALEEGSLPLASILLLVPHLTAENADALIREASGLSRSEIEVLLSARPNAEVGSDLFSPDPGSTLVPGRVEAESTEQADVTAFVSSAAQPIVRRTLPIGVLPATRVKLQRLKELLAHQVPSGDLADVLDRACDIALRQIERRKFAAAKHPRRAQGSKDPRSIPAQVRRAVRARDGNRCTFVSEDGRRCTCRSRLEFDHIIPVARGGRSTVKNVRLLCRSHNQFVAEKVFGKGFMVERRAAARAFTSTKEAASPAAPVVVTTAPGTTATMTAESEVADGARRAVEERTRLLLSGLRELGYPAREAREAADYGAGAVDLSLEDQMKRALSWFRPRTTLGGD